MHLVEWVGSGTPVSQEHAEANSLEYAGKNTDCDSVEWTLLSDNGSNELLIMLALFLWL